MALRMGIEPIISSFGGKNKNRTYIFFQSSSDNDQKFFQKFFRKAGGLTCLPSVAKNKHKTDFPKIFS